MLIDAGGAIDAMYESKKAAAKSKRQAVKKDEQIVAELMKLLEGA